MYVYLGLRARQHLIGARNEMMMDDYDGQMIFGDLVGLKLPDIRLTAEEKTRKNLTQKTGPDWGSNPGPLRDKRACYHLFHSPSVGLATLPLPSAVAVYMWTLLAYTACNGDTFRTMWLPFVGGMLILLYDANHKLLNVF